jgi:DNA-binding LytR/AlgR family response regulator
MQIEIILDERYQEPKLVLFASQMTEELNDLIGRLSESGARQIAAYVEDRVELLQPEDVVRIYAERQKVYLETDRVRYTLRARLYEVEARLDKRMFARISVGEIVNLRKVKSLDLSAAGTIQVRLVNGVTTWVSRRHMSDLKKTLGI